MNTNTNCNEREWEAPRPLRVKPDLVEFPLEALPPVMREMVNAVAVTTATDAGMAGTAMLSAVGYCFAGVYRLAGKADHTEPPVLYSLIIAQPSERKSPVMHFIKEPFDTFERRYNKVNREEMYKAQQEKLALEARIKAMEKEEEPDISAIAKLRVQAEDITDTSPIRLAVDDITPEALSVALSENGSLLMISDEAGMLSNFSGKYTNGMPNLDLLLKSWNGEKYICDRILRGNYELEQPYLSVALAGQPYIWDNMMSDDSFRASGLLSRFIHCFAESNVGFRRYDTEPIPEKVRRGYNALIQVLLKRKLTHKGGEVILSLSPEASKEYIDLCNNFIEKELKTSMCCCQDWGGKFHGLILRIACILHCTRCVCNGTEPEAESVSLDTLTRAFSLAHYYRYQAIYAFSTNAPDGDIMRAERVVSILKSKEIKQATRSELYQACRCSIFPKQRDFISALDTLAEYGYIAYENTLTTNNRKVQIVHVNPKI